MRIVWLASWYPNPLNPFDGDFVQRHAKALSLYNPVTVFHVSQSSEHSTIKENKIIEKNNDGILEKIIFFYFRNTGIPFWDKLIYNWRYYRTYRKIIREYFLKEGRPDLVHVHVPMKAGMIAKWIRKHRGVPYIVSEHSAHYRMDTDDDFLGKGFIYRRSVTKIFQKAAAVTNVSAAMGNIIKELFALKTVHIIHNTVDISLFNYQISDSGKFRFIHVSTLAESQKNIKGILRAVRNLSNARRDFELIIIGPAQDQLKKIIKESGLQEFVILTGEIPYSDVAKQMQQASALILFSRYENFPCVIIEGLCCGLPVIASDVGGVKEVVNGYNGILVPSENEAELVQSMNRMMNDYQQFDREQIAKDAREKFNYSAVGKQFYDLYKRILEQK